MMLVWRSRRCHFPSSATAVTWKPSEGSIRGDRAALCLHTEFNHSSPHLHRPRWEAARCESQSLWWWGWKEIWREEDSRKGTFVNSGMGGWGGHVNVGKLSEEEKTALPILNPLLNSLTWNSSQVAPLQFYEKAKIFEKFNIRLHR